MNHFERKSRLLKSKIFMYNYSFLERGVSPPDPGLCVLLVDYQRLLNREKEDLSSKYF